MTISSPGIGSSLDVNSIVSQLMALERAPLDIITKKTAAIQAKISSFGSIKSALSTFQTALAKMTDVSKMSTLTGASSDASSATISASAGSSAVAASYSLEVTQLAQAQKLATLGQSSAQNAIGSGTITFDFGTIEGGELGSDGKYGAAEDGSTASFTSNGSGQKSITITDANNSLSGIRDAINSANIGVTASIVNDGSSTPYRLVLTDTRSGKASSMKISVTGDGGDPALSNLLSHDPSSMTGQALTQTQSAQDALFKIDGIAISKASNSVTDAIDGVTLTLLKPTTTVPVALSLTGDNAAITASITQFVSAYNQITKTLKDVSAYNPTTKVSATLSGDATVRSLQTQLRAIMMAPIAGSANVSSSLSQIGVAFQTDGTLALDDTKLQAALVANPAAVTGLFAAVGSASDGRVSFSGSTDKTIPGAYAVTVSQIAARGAYAGTTSPTKTTVDANNNTMEVLLNGVTASITLTDGNYTPATLASEIQSRINGAAEFSAIGSSVTVSAASDGTLSIQSARYGASSQVSIASGGSDFFGTAPTSSAGTDVAGTIHGGAASGSGQYLTGATDNAAEGLRLQISGSLTADETRGTVNYSQGYAYQLDRMITALLSTTGAIASKTTGLAASVTAMGKDGERVSANLTAIEARYRSQFTALDVLMAKMTTTSNFLTQQFASMTANA